MLSYHNDPTLKSSFVAHVKAQGRACTLFGLRPNDHAGLSRKLDVPMELLCLNERIFEKSSSDYSSTWPVRFAEAVPVGKDLSMVAPRLMHWMLGELPNWAGLDAKRDADVITVISIVQKLYERWIDSDEPSESEWIAARSKAVYIGATAEGVSYNCNYITYFFVVDATSYAGPHAAYDRADAFARIAYHFEVMERIGDKLLELIQTA